jgi:hypothetical protein
MQRLALLHPSKRNVSGKLLFIRAHDTSNCGERYRRLATTHESTEAGIQG